MIEKSIHSEKEKAALENTNKEYLDRFIENGHEAEYQDYTKSIKIHCGKCGCYIGDAKHEESGAICLSCYNGSGAVIK